MESRDSTASDDGEEELAAYEAFWMSGPGRGGACALTPTSNSNPWAPGGTEILMVPFAIPTTFTSTSTKSSTTSPGMAVSGFGCTQANPIGVKMMML